MLHGPALPGRLLRRRPPSSIASVVPGPICEPAHLTHAPAFTSRRTDSRSC
jgi:hypothetical protein